MYAQIFFFTKPRRKNTLKLKTKLTNWTVRCVAVSGDCDSFNIVIICCKPSGCGSHVIFTLCMCVCFVSLLLFVAAAAVDWVFVRENFLIQFFLELHQIYAIYFLYLYACNWMCVCVWVLVSACAFFSIFFFILVVRFGILVKMFWCLTWWSTFSCIEWLLVVENWLKAALYATIREKRKMTDNVNVFFLALSPHLATVN